MNFERNNPSQGGNAGDGMDTTREKQENQSYASRREVFVRKNYDYIYEISASKKI